MSVVKRLRDIRIAEGLSQANFAKEVDINVDTLRQWEQGRRPTMRTNELEKITSHPRFEKYALWLVTGKSAPEVGQIQPETEKQRTG